MSNNSYNAKNKVGLNIYHLDPRWTTYEEFDWFADRGLVNSFILAADSSTMSGVIGGAQKAMENGSQVWLTLNPFLSCEQSLSEYMKVVERKVNMMKEKEVFDCVVGFHWDEPLLNQKHTNQDLYDMTKALYNEYGLRNGPVFSVYELVGMKGNMQDPDGNTVLQEFATEYLTDIGFDSYGYDFRTPYTEAQTEKIKSLGEKYPGVDSTETYYKYFNKVLRDRVINKNAKLWVYPCTYTPYTWAGIFADEDYCTAHLKGLTKVLLEDENPGGISCYTYKTWSRHHKGLDILLQKDNPNRWEKFEQAMREVYDQVKDIEIK